MQATYLGFQEKSQWGHPPLQAKTEETETWNNSQKNLTKSLILDSYCQQVAMNLRMGIFLKDIEMLFTMEVVHPLNPGSISFKDSHTHIST